MKILKKIAKVLLIIFMVSAGNYFTLYILAWGGMLASPYIARYPETVNKLVLAEPGLLTRENANRSGIDLQLGLSWQFYV